jgi:hypothetical protein
MSAWIAGRSSLDARRSMTDISAVLINLVHIDRRRNVTRGENPSELWSGGMPILEQMGYEVTTFKVTWGLPPKARLRLKSNGGADIQKVNAMAGQAEPSRTTPKTATARQLQP